jgi:polyisoprenyl-teichoic acid--peptidoglycan teichoic acid transferase
MPRHPKAAQRKAPILTAFLLLVIVFPTLTGCTATATPTSVVVVAPTAVAPSPTPSLTALPRLVAAEPRTMTPSPSPSLTPSSTATDTPTATSSATSTATSTSTSTFTPSATTTASRTPTPPGPTITPTETLSPTLTPTLTPTPIYSPTPMPTPSHSGDFMHLLLIGIDSARNLRAQNTDVIIVAVVNKDTKQVSLLSIPRDLWVYIPTYGWSRINVAHRYGYARNYPGGGPGLLAETIRVNLGLPTDHWARVDFEGFARVVDELGGVQMTVACPVNLRYKPPTSEEEEEMILEPGVYDMDGALALRYVRTRRGGSDFDRARRQHQFLKAMWQQTKSPGIILKIPGLWSALRDSFETDLDLGGVLELAPIALDLQPQRIRSRYIDSRHTTDWTNADGWQVLLPRHDRIQQVVTSLYAPPSADDEQVAKENARIEVWNGTYQPQMALIAADHLRWYGLKVVDAAPAETPGYAETQIVVFAEKPKALAVLVRELNVKQSNVIYELDSGQDADIRVILGSDYDPCR